MKLIPYAPWDLEHLERTGEQVRVCPVCGERITETWNEAEDNPTNNYSRHYVDNHGGGRG